MNFAIRRRVVLVATMRRTCIKLIFPQSSNFARAVKFEFCDPSSGRTGLSRLAVMYRTFLPQNSNFARSRMLNFAIRRRVVLVSTMRRTCIERIFPQNSNFARSRKLNFAIRRRVALVPTMRRICTELIFPQDSNFTRGAKFECFDPSSGRTGLNHVANIIQTCFSSVLLLLIVVGDVLVYLVVCLFFVAQCFRSFCFVPVCRLS